MATRKQSRSEDAAVCDDPMSNLAVASASQCTRESAPIEKLLGIFELCKQVLDNLSMNDILHAMQACRAFKSNVENSTKLQVKLFSTPETTYKSRITITVKGTLLSGIEAAHHIVSFEAAGERHTSEVQFHVPHPVLQRFPEYPSIKIRGLVTYVVRRAMGSLSGKAAIRDSALSSADIWSKQSTSLENMFLTQPPTQAIRLAVRMSEDISTETDIFVETGVKFGDVFKAMRAAAGGLGRGVPSVQLSFGRAILANARAQALVESVGELSVFNDPTRWVRKDGGYVLKEGGFEFL